MAVKDPRELAQALTLTNPQAAINGGTPTIQAKPQRFKRRPGLKDYGLNPSEGPYKDYRDAYYYSEPDDVDIEIEHLKEGLREEPNNAHYTKRLNVLSDPNLQKYLRDSRAFSSQFEKDYEEYYPTAKDAIIRKLLGDGELYQSKTYGPGDYRHYADDLGDAINAEFSKKYGYDEIYDGELFSPIRHAHGWASNGLGNEESEGVKTENGGRIYRRPYDKTKYIAELLRNGEITLDDLKRYILGK